MLQGQQVLADRAEVRQLEQCLVVRPVLQHLLVPARSIGRQALAVDDLRGASLGERVIRKVLEHLRLAVDASHDDVVAIHGRARRGAGALAPGEHIEERQCITATRARFGKSCHCFFSRQQKAAQWRG